MAASISVSEKKYIAYKLWYIVNHTTCMYMIEIINIRGDSIFVNFVGTFYTWRKPPNECVNYMLYWLHMEANIQNTLANL